MRSLDLFSCIGAHALGFHRAGIETVALCEDKPWRRDVLARNFRGIKIYDDVRTIDPPEAEIVFGGPPCQKTSVAAAIHGKRSGESLWSFMLDVGIAAGAEWIVVEQPTGNKAWERTVQEDLARASYFVARVEFAASDVGAPYPRRRVYTMGCTSLSRLEVAWRSVPSAIKAVARAADARADWCPDKLATLPVVARDAGDMDRGPRSAYRQEAIDALGDSNPPHMAEVIGRAIMASNNR